MEAIKIKTPSINEGTRVQQLLFKAGMRHDDDTREIKYGNIAFFYTEGNTIRYGWRPKTYQSLEQREVMFDELERMVLRNLKIKLHLNNQEESERAQRAMFALGYEWPSGKEIRLFESRHYLFLEEDGKIYAFALDSHGRMYVNLDSPSFFKNHDAIEITLPELEAMAAKYAALNPVVDSKDLIYVKVLAYKKSESIMIVIDEDFQIKSIGEDETISEDDFYKLKQALKYIPAKEFNHASWYLIGFRRVSEKECFQSWFEYVTIQRYEKH